MSAPEAQQPHPPAEQQPPAQQPPAQPPPAEPPPAEPPQPAPQPPPERRRFPSGFLVTVLAVVGLFVVVGFLRDLWPNFDISNPFREETVDRTGPALLKSIQDLREYRAASGHFEVIVDIEKETRFIPSAIKGERVLFVAVGRVDAGVDFTGLDEKAVEVSQDRRTVRILLPPARFHEAQLDLERSYVYDRDRGLIDRVQSLVGGGDDDVELYRLAERRLAAAARDGSGLLARAESNTRTMLVSLLRSLGFERVEIRFAAV